MKTTLFGLFLAGLLATGISISSAYANEGHHGHHERMMEHMNKELNLTDEQRARVEAVFKEQHAKYQALHEETKTKLDAILNDEQKAKMEEMKAERKARWEKKREECGKRHTAE